MSRGKRFKIIFFFSLAVILLAGVLVISRALDDPQEITDDRLVTVQKGTLALSVVATGSVIPVTTVELKSKASGLVKEILVEEGARIHEGQVLVELDKELLQAQLRESEASRMAVAAKFEETQAEEVSARTLKKKMLLDARNLQDNLEFRGREVARYRRMSEEKIIAFSDLDKQERDYQEALLTLEALRSELLMQDARIEASGKAVARARAEVVQADAALDRVRENLRYATIVSPIEGTVLKRHVEVGDAVSSILQLGSQATLLMTLGDMSEVFVEGRVDESDIGSVFVGQKARVKVDAFRERSFPGEVVRIAPLGEKQDNVIGFDVRVSIQDEEKILRAQMSANAEIIIEERQDILLIPESAIIYDRDRNTFAELYDRTAENAKRRVAIRLGISNGTSTEILEGLEEGVQLVVEPRGIL